MDENKELYKFLYNPQYREHVITKIHKEEDKAYERRIKVCEKQKRKQIKDRELEIDRIEKSRWQDIGGKISVNNIEGKVKINNKDVLFSSVKGAEINVIYGTRAETTSNEKVKTKKNPSLGGAVAGGMVLGPVGAVAGGVGLAKTKEKRTGSTVTKEIPTCLHLGVQVNIDGFVSEIILLSHQVDQSSNSFNRAMSDAQNIVSQLSVLANTPVPESFLKVEEEPSVVAMDSIIKETEKELQIAIEDRPTYILPDIYRTEEQKNLTDEQYLEYLSNTDGERVREISIIKEEEKRKKNEERAVKQAEIKEKVMNVDYASGAKRAGTVILQTILWVLSVIILIFALLEFSQSGVLSGFLLILTTIITNPIGQKIIKEKIKLIPFWFFIILGIVCFFVAAIISPTADNNNQETINQELSNTN